MNGIIEGFYGRPWSWAMRHEVLAHLSEAGMDTYLYAPKSDPLHRENWREPYGDLFLAEMEALTRALPMEIGFGVSPGLSIDPGDHDDRQALLDKIITVVERGISLVALLFDDLPPAPGLGESHGQLAAWVIEQLPEELEIIVVPVHYTGWERTPYLAALDELLPADVLIGWTGRYVVNEAISAEDAKAWRNAMGGRRPLLWDNTPVNDAFMTDRLFTGPLRGRDPLLPAELGGYLANPMIQARASVPPLLSAAAWWRGDDPEVAWGEALGDARILAEGCDAVGLMALAERALSGDDAAGSALEEWLVEASTCDDGGWGEDVAPWVEQLRTEASVALMAMRALRAERDEARRLAAGLVLSWPQLRTAQISVLGGRGGVRPAFSQSADDGWIGSQSAFVPAASITDRLVEAAFARLGA